MCLASKKPRRRTISKKLIANLHSEFILTRIVPQKLKKLSKKLDKLTRRYLTHQSEDTMTCLALNKAPNLSSTHKTLIQTSSSDRCSRVRVLMNFSGKHSQGRVCIWEAEDVEAWTRWLTCFKGWWVDSQRDKWAMLRYLGVEMEPLSLSNRLGVQECNFSNSKGPSAET